MDSDDESSDDGSIVDGTPPPSPGPRRSVSPLRILRDKRPGEPDVYRLPQHKHGGSQHSNFGRKEIIRFRFGTRYVTASGQLCDSRHPNVWRIRLFPSFAQQLITRIARAVPAFLGSWAKRVFPEWFLPDDLILKTRKWHDEATIADDYYTREITSYKRLQPVQGKAAPIFYGQVFAELPTRTTWRDEQSSYHREEALLLQDVGGVSLAQVESMTLDLEDLTTMLKACYTLLHTVGLHQGDPQLGNFILLDGHLMAVDFEMAMFDLSEDDATFFMKADIGHLGNQYQDLRRFYWSEGWLLGS